LGSKHGHPLHRSEPRGLVMQVMHHKILHSKKTTSKVEEDDEEPVQKISQAEAAVTIQSHWRARKGPENGNTKSQRNAEMDRKFKSLFHTHTLGLTFKSKKAQVEREMQMNLGEKIFILLDDPSSGPGAQLLSTMIIMVTMISIAGFVLETVDDLQKANPTFWVALDVVCTLVFTVEYVAHVSTCQFAELSPISYMLEPMSVCDLMAILPWYIEVLIRSLGFQASPALKAFKVVRLIRVLRVFKLGRYAKGMQVMGKALYDSTQAISVLIFLLCVGVVLFASTLWYVERMSCPPRADFAEEDLAKYNLECSQGYNRDVSPTYGLCCDVDDSPVEFPSIPTACWWAVVTMTSVGYGDIYPRTIQGKCVGIAAGIAGLLLIALPIAIIGQKFQDIYEINDRSEEKQRVINRMKGGPGETWTLIPGSDVVQRLSALNFKDEKAKRSVKHMTKCFQEIWERRESLGRERKYVLSQRGHMQKTMIKFMDAMHQLED